MQRRNFIKIVGLGGTFIMFNGLQSCKTDNQSGTIREEWNPENVAKQYDDIRLKILCFAILAPNPHNKQPWKIDLSKTDEISLYVDEERLLPMTDPFHRQIYIGQGTFLEMLSISAKEFGYNPKIELFPDGVDSVKNTGKSPVAKISLVKADVQKDKLFKYIPFRVTNRRTYTGPALAEIELQELNKSYDMENYPVMLVTDSEKIKKLSEIMTEGMKIETFLDRTHAETVNMIRFNDEEITKYRDGFGFEQLGVTGISKFFAEKFIGRDKAFSNSFKERTISATNEMTKTAKAFGIMFSKNNERIDQVEMGRRYSRVHLTATKLSLAMQPMSQVLQEYEELSEVQKRFLETIKPFEGIPQMLFRIGRAEPTPHSPRRKLVNFLEANLQDS